MKEKDSFYRFVLRLPPILLIVVGVVQLSAAVAAWGAAEHAGIAAPLTTVVGVAFGLPVLLLGLLLRLEVVKRTRGPFSVSLVLLSAGFGALLLAAVALVVLAVRIADPATYDSLLTAGGQPNVSPAGFLFISLFSTAFFGGFLVLVSYLYVQAITSMPRTVFDRRDDERDGVGALLAGAPRPQSDGRSRR